MCSLVGKVSLTFMKIAQFGMLVLFATYGHHGERKNCSLVALEKLMARMNLFS